MKPLLNRVSSALIKLIQPVSSSQNVDKDGPESSAAKDAVAQQPKKQNPKKEQKGEKRPHLELVKSGDPKPQDIPPTHSSVSTAFIHLIERLKRQRGQIKSWVAANRYNQTKSKRRKKNSYRKGTVVDDTVE